MNWAWVPVRKGAVTMHRAMVAAASAPWAVRTRCRHRSMPAATPAAVQTPPSSTKSASGTTSTAGWAADRSVVRFQWVTARRPSSSPAWARTKAPPQREATGMPAVWARRSASRTGSGTGARWSSTPGTTTRSAVASHSRSRSGVSARPPGITTGARSGAQRRSSKRGAPRVLRSTPQTSVMTAMSKARMPGKATRATRWVESDSAAVCMGVIVALIHRTSALLPLSMS